MISVLRVQQQTNKGNDILVSKEKKNEMFSNFSKHEVHDCNKLNEIKTSDMSVLFIL